MGTPAPVKDVQRQRDHRIDHMRLEECAADTVLVVGLAALDLRCAILADLASLLLDFGLAAEEHTLRANDAGAPLVRECGEDMSCSRGER